MNELNGQLLAFLKIISAAVFGLLYGFGGMFKKWIRRIAAPIWLAVVIVLITYLQKTISLWYFIWPLLLMGTLTIGYGSDKLEKKLIKRSLYGLAMGMSPLPIAIITNNWILFGFNCFLCIAVSIVLGVFNPCRNARDEETLIAVSSVIIPIFML